MSKKLEKKKAAKAKKQVLAGSRPNPRRDWLLALMIGLVTLLLFLPAKNYDFVLWDDDVNVTKNENVQSLNSENLERIFTDRVIGNYNPLTILSFAVEHHFWGLDPSVYHLNNILLHAVCTLLVFMLLRRLGMNLFISVVAALLFGIHPMRVESVAWVTERKDVLFSLFFLLSLLAYIRFYRTRKWHLYALSMILFILSLLSKIQAVSLPLVLLLIDFHFEGRFRVNQVWNKVPFFMLSLATGLAGVYFLQQEGSLETGNIIPLYERVFIGTYSLLVYLVKALVPYQLSAIYPFPANLGWMHYASLPLVLALAYGVWRIRRWRKELIFGLLFFLFNIMFVLQVVGAGQGYLADRFTYMPYLGLFFIIAFMLDAWRLGNWKLPLYALTGILVIALAVLTSNRIPVWQNTETLFTDVLKKYTKVAVAHNNMGKYYRESNEYPKAIASYTKALEIDPKGYATYSNRGKAYFDTGRVDEALDDFNKSISINPDYAEALSNRGAALASKSRFAEALADLDKAIQLDPNNAVAFSNRSLAHYMNRDFTNAVKDVDSYLRLKPDDSDMINTRALCYSELGENDKALADFNRAIALKPTQGVFFQNRSFYYNRIGDKQSALNDILRAQQLGVNVNPDYLNSLRVQ